jgi:hypothetical protein
MHLDLAVHLSIDASVIYVMEGSTGRHGMGEEHGMKPALLWLMWEKMDPAAKKTLVLRMLDGKIMKKEAHVKYLQHKVETYRMVRQMMEKMM